MGFLKFITLVSGVQKLVSAVQVGGSGKENSVVATGADGLIDSSLMPSGFGVDAISVPASENLAGGDFINLWNDGGTVKARKANASAEGTRAMGFVLSSVVSPANALVYLEGRNTAKTGLTLAQQYWLSDSVPGDVTTTPPSTGAGKIVQLLGMAYSPTAMSTEGLNNDYVVLES